MDGTAKDMGLKGRDVYDPTSQLMPLQDTCAICWMLLAAIWKTLASYNWGLGNVQKKGMDNLPSETRNYVPKVMAGMRPGAGMAVDRAMPGRLAAFISFMAPKSPPRPRTWNSLPATSKSTATTASCFWLATQDNNSCRFL
jgi:hypothetical protein